MTTTIPLRAFHGDPKIKAKYLARVRAHAKADEVIAGQYWENGKGCAVGCTLHSDQHAAYETELGIPTVLARLEDGLFERIWKRDAARAKAWPDRFLSAPKSGADLTMVWPRFAHWLLVDEKEGVIQFAKTNKTRGAIKDVAELYARWLAGDKPAQEEWASDAYAAYAASATSDASAASAAYAAYATYAASAAKYSERIFRCSDKLIELMEAAQ